MSEQNENKEEKKKPNWFVRWWNSLDNDFRNIVYIICMITSIIFIIIFIGAVFLPNDVSHHVKTLDYNGHRYIIYNDRGIAHDPDCLCHYKRITDK